jgi:hypothetical protein
METKHVRIFSNFDDDFTGVDRARRRFTPGDRVVWDGLQVGTLLRYLDDSLAAVRWDDPTLGSTMVPVCFSRLRRLVPALTDWAPAEDRTTPDAASSTLPGGLVTFPGWWPCAR